MDARFEDKYPLTKDVVGDFQFWLTGVDGARFRRTFPSRIVNSIYFDSRKMSAYLDNVEGMGSRRKVRVRWYGETFEPQSLRFEVKIRNSGCGTKKWSEIEGPRVQLQPYRSLASRLRRELPPELRVALDECPVAVLISRYRREYYATATDVRLTVDSDMSSRKLIGSRFFEPRAIPTSVSAVVEVKYAVDSVEAARLAMRSFPVNASKNSKYARAVESWV